MRTKTLPLLTLFLLLLLTTGCIEIHLDTDLEKDGSGTGKLEMAISPKVTRVLAEVQDIDDMPETHISNLAGTDEDELKRIAAKANVEIDHFESEVRDGRRTVSFEMKFDSLKDYSWVLGNVLDEVGDGFGVFAGEDGQLIFREARYDYSALLADEPEPAEPTDPSEETIDKYLEMMDVINGDRAAAKVLNVIKVPGDIIDSDATATDGRTCTWTLDFAAIVADKDNLKPRIVFSDKGLKIKPLPEQEF